jgi:predicted ATPase/DNA-binding CsgD family transcriptional regulator
MGSPKFGAGMATTGTKRSMGNLPLEVATFVGRQGEAAEVKRLLKTARLVSLIGVGGVGKTRLALHVTADVRRAFADGVWLADLAALLDEALVSQTVAGALGIRDESAQWPVALLCDYLVDKQLLLVLDNCEHLRDACAVLVDALLHTAPELRIVATSRQAFGLPAEHTLTVAPLPTPDPDTPATVAELAAYDAVRLFVERASAALPGFALSPQNAAAVVRLCARLDGLPLAIELAAVRVRALSPEQILDRLDERYRLLRADNPAAPARQQSLRGLLDWSFDLCSDEERTLWARLSVFAGSFDLESVEDICSGDGLGREAIADLVVGLVDKSVLSRDPRPDRRRYRLLETIREYGHERLAATEGELTLRRRHRDHYLQRAERAAAAAESISADEMAWITSLQEEHTNVRAALDFSAAEPGEAHAGLRLVATMWFHWQAAGLVSEGRRWLDRLLALATEPTATRAKALWADAWLAIIQGDLGAASALLEESRALGQQLRDDSVLAYTAQFSGQAAMCRGNMTEAASLLDQALAGHRKTGDTVGIAMTQIRLALVLSFLGNSERATELAAEILELSELVDAPWWQAYARWVLAVETWHRGDTEQATSLARQSLRINRDLNDRLGAALAAEVLAWTAASDGHAERAARLLGALGQSWRTLEGPFSGFGYLSSYREQCLAVLCNALGDTAVRAAMARGARLSFEQALALALDEHPETGGRGTSVPSPSPLTRREQEIAELIGRGLSNRGIANELVISQRTAEGHVEHILAKLGFNSRAQIAAWVAQRGDRRDQPMS